MANSHAPNTCEYFDMHTNAPTMCGQEAKRYLVNNVVCIDLCDNHRDEVIAQRGWMVTPSASVSSGGGPQ